MKVYASEQKARHAIEAYLKVAAVVPCPAFISAGKKNNGYFVAMRRIYEPSLQRQAKEKAKDVFLRKFAPLLARLHLFYKRKAARPLFDYVFKGNCGAHEADLRFLARRFRCAFQEKTVYYIHGDLDVVNVLYARDVYFIDYDHCRFGDFYYDLACVFLNICDCDMRVFRAFLGYYARIHAFQFSDERFLINVLLCLSVKIKNGASGKKAMRARLYLLVKHVLLKTGTSEPPGSAMRVQR